MLTCSVVATVESSNVEMPAAETTVSSEPKSTSADDSNVWTKPLPVTEEKSRFAFHRCQLLDVFYKLFTTKLTEWNLTLMVHSIPYPV